MYFPFSNSAVLSVERSWLPGTPHVLLLAGQHGDESGPVAGLLGFEAPLNGRMSVVNCANPMGVALGRRGYLGSVPGSVPGKWRDMNREWGSGEGVTHEIWEAVTRTAEQVPDIVVDLHSSTSPSVQRTVIAADERSRPFAERVAGVLREVHPDWRVVVLDSDTRKSLHVDATAGTGSTLIEWAASQGSIAIAVEFPSRLDLSEPVTGILPGERIRNVKGPKDQRTMTLAELSTGVALLAEHLRLLATAQSTPIAADHGDSAMLEPMS